LPDLHNRLFSSSSIKPFLSPDCQGYSPIFIRKPENILSLNIISIMAWYVNFYPARILDYNYRNSVICEKCGARTYADSPLISSSSNSVIENAQNYILSQISRYYFSLYRPHSHKRPGQGHRLGNQGFWKVTTFHNITLDLQSGRVRLYQLTRKLRAFLED
jgi:hypothetical protein